MALNRHRLRRRGPPRDHAIDYAKFAPADARSKPVYDQYIPSPRNSTSVEVKNGVHHELYSGSLSAHKSTAVLPSAKSSTANGSISNGVFIPKIAKNEVVGTDFKTGVNPHDAQFPQLFMHAHTLSQIPFYGDSDKKKSFKVTYDPDLDKTLSKEEKKTKQKKFIFFDPSAPSTAKDPRKRKSFSGGLEGYLNKPNKHSKKFPFRQLPQTTFVYDKDSLGPAPLTELVVWDLPSTTSEVYLLNFFKSYGSAIKDLKLLNDPDYGVPLGVASFRFQGSTEKAARLAHAFIADVKANHMKLDGVELKIDLNDHENSLLNSKIGAAQDRLLKEKQRIEESERRRQKEAEEAKRRQEQLREAKAKEMEKKEITKEVSATPEIIDSNYTIRSIKHNNRRVPGVFLPIELAKYVKVRPFLLIKDIYIPTKRISSQDIKKALNRYNWTRVLSDKLGFFIVFNDIKECERCFYKEDGKRFYEYRMYMEMNIPEGYNRNAVKEKEQKSYKSNDVVNEAINVLIKEFQMYLTKDIRERVIAPQILELLSDDRYPKLMEELKAKEAAKKASTPAIATPKPTTSSLSLLATRRIQELGPLPSFRKKQSTKKDGVARPFVNRTIIPMQHALNFDNESDDSEDGESSRSMTPVAPNFKRQLSSTATSVSNDDFDKALEKAAEPPSKKHKKMKKSFLYESSDEAEDIKPGDDLGDNMKVDQIKPGEPEEVEEDLNALQEIYQPTTDFPRPVYEEQPLFTQDALDLQYVQDFVKDEEDFELVKEILQGTEMDTSIKHLDYWAWKKKEASRSGIVSDEADIQGPLLPRLASKTGAFRSDGYKKIPDADKIEYLPHRRKIHKPLKTVQHDEDDNNTTNNSSTNTNNIQSSRVNRANNRRLAADISAQKQMIGSETDILNLNALTKRKKPVSFARSAIHNWGLYALEPIAAREMIIEYVGESIRQQVAEHREKSYIKTGIGSSYLFRIDENTVIDATKKGGIARFINHCCSPSCTAKIIKVDGKKRIVIYALRDIEANEELTYDYKFERETNDAERIRCLCGAPGCKGYLN